MATYYFRNTGTNWNLTASWSSTPSPTYTNVTTVPGIADDVFFEAASANCTITTVAAAADRIDFTNGGTSNYTGLFTVGTTGAGSLTVSRSLALSPSMSDVTGSAAITFPTNTTCAITSSGKSIHSLSYISFGPNLTLNLADTLIIKNNITTTYSNGGPAVIFNGGDIMLRGVSYFQNITAGTSTMYINPQAGQTASFFASTFGTFSNNLIISGSGRVNFDTAIVYASGKITYVTASGVTFTNNHNLQLTAGTVTLDTAGMMWNRCDLFGGNRIMILSSSLNISRSFSYSNNSITTVSVNGSRINAYGNVNINTAGGINLNSVHLTITGSASGRTLTNFNNMVTSASLEFKLTGGSITVAPSAITILNGTQVEILNNSTGGTIIASGSTITVGATGINTTPRFNTNTILWGNLVSAGAANSANTITLLSPLLISSSITFGASLNTTFTGSAGWTCANLICTTAGRTLTLANSSSGASYRTTDNAALTGGTAAAGIAMTSNNPTTQSIWTLDNGAIQSLIYVNGTRIDSSQGQTIWSFGGTLNGTTNWGTGSRPLTVANTFVC
jgi:hypothetical protein